MLPPDGKGESYRCETANLSPVQNFGPVCYRLKRRAIAIPARAAAVIHTGTSTIAK